MGKTMTDFRNSTARRIAAAAITVATATLGAAIATTPATAAPISSPAHTQAPGAAELDAKLGVIMDRGAPSANRAAELEAGESALGTMDQIADIKAKAPGLQYRVVNPATSGDRIDAQLLVTTPGYPDFTYDLAWQQFDGSWKLTQASVCALAGALALSC